MKNVLTTTLLTGTALLAIAAGRPAAAQSGVITIDFDTLTHPASGVGPAQQVYQEQGTGGFTLLRIADPNNPSSFADHFHTVAGNGSAGHANSTAAEFFSDDGSPFLYYYGDYTGTNSNNYAPNLATAKTFSLLGFSVLTLDGGPFVLTSSNGATLTIDHAGVYSAATADLSGFQNITSYRHDYTGATDGDMIVDNITIAATPEPSAAVVLCLGTLGLGTLAFRKSRRAV